MFAPSLSLHVCMCGCVQEMVTSQYFKEWTTLAAPFSSTLIFNTARPQEDFKELLEDEAFQRPCGLCVCARDVLVTCASDVW